MFWSKKAKNARPLQARQLKSDYEKLEKKELFAGLVNVGYDPVTNNMTLLGDPLNNQVTISQAPGNGPITVTGNLGTLINGAPSLTFPGPFLGNVSTNMGLGNDAITFSNVVFGNLTTLELGAGNDRVTLNNVKAKGNVAINTLDGNDNVRLTGQYAGHINIVTGIGADTVRVSGDVGVVMNALGVLDPEYYFGSSNASGNGKNLRVDTNNGNDAITLVDLDVDGLINILAGNNNDTVVTTRTRASNRINAYLGAGDDQMTIENVLTPIMNVYMEDGRDTLTQNPGALPTARRVDGGNGLDTLDLNGGPGWINLNVENIIP